MKKNKDTCNYEVVNSIDDSDETGTAIDRARLSLWNLLRQVLISSTMWTLYFIYGLQIGAPTVIIPQLQKEANSSTLISDDLGSWLSSMFSVGALPWTLILPVVGYKIGRKKTYIFICFIGFIGVLIIFLSKTITHILVGEFVMGIILGGHNTISPFIITEYSSPKYRGLFMTIKSASGLWGIWVANTIGTYWHWKKIYLLMFLCNVYTLTVFAWPESPYWLAKQRRITECAGTFRSLKGTSEDAEKELENIINSFELNENNVENFDTKSFNSFYNTFFKLLMTKTYYCPLLLAILICVQYHMTGKLICSIYAIQILKKITQNDTMAYKGMLILDGITVFSTYCGCVVSRFCKRRKMLFTTSLLTITFLYIFSLYLFLVHQTIIVENNIISISLLAFFSITVCSGPMILLTSIYGELISFKHHRSSTMIYGATNTIVMAVSLKSSLFLFKQLTLPGLFLFFAVSSSIITFILYLYLPETKNKSCYEIENYFKKIPDQKTKGTMIMQPDL
ncbi:unnamed protein product [Euphydryas editha]|uniref:Major facilitator superfamily (MFS) profile domain-containing protein n=1 Tax=Euphydryas editha TaxID=104508 RepID=A0AAU9TEA2_EUPED|nr:unnamed protein product [Euphydryas editha]